MARTTLLPATRWTPDCQGKQDYDGPILDVSTRYWPDFKAHSAILLRIGPVNGDTVWNYLIWSSCEFEGASEAAVKADVEKWVQKEFAAIIKLLGGRRAFKKP